MSNGKRLNLFREKKKPRKKVNDKVFDMMTTVADKTDVDLEKTAKLDKSTKSIHTALMAAGMTPGIGNIADITDATLYALEGELGNAAWSAAAAIPIIGQMVAGKRALKAAKKAGEETVTLWRGVKSWHRGLMVKEGKFRGTGGEYGDNLWVSMQMNIAKGYAEIRDWSLRIDESDPVIKRLLKERSNLPRHQTYYEGTNRQIRTSEGSRSAKIMDEINVKIKKRMNKISPTWKKSTSKKESPGPLLEFEVPKSYLEKHGMYSNQYYEDAYEFWPGIPKEFLKKIHK